MEGKMPIISVEGPKVADVEKKRLFARELSEVAARYYDMPAEKIILLIKENEPENVAVGGELIADR